MTSLGSYGIKKLKMWSTNLLNVKFLISSGSTGDGIFFVSSIKKIIYCILCKVHTGSTKEMVTTGYPNEKFTLIVVVMLEQL